MWDCVDKLAKRAYERGIDVLVHEDLTEFFSYGFEKGTIISERFSRNYIGKFPEGFYKELIAERKIRPWLWPLWKK